MHARLDLLAVRPGRVAARQEGTECGGAGGAEAVGPLRVERHREYSLVDLVEDLLPDVAGKVTVVGSVTRRWSRVVVGVAGDLF